MATIDDVMRRVRELTGRRRIDLRSFFDDFDRLNSGRITASQFARVLHNNGVTLTAEELEVLTSTFNAKVPQSDDVLYGAFVASLYAEDGSTAAVRRSTATTALTNAEEERLQPVLRLLQHAVRSHGTALTSPFRDLDPLRTGKVTATQFDRCLPFQSTLTPDAMRLFAKKYGDGNGNVYYMAWCRAIDPSLREEEQAATQGATHTTYITPTAFSGCSSSFKNPNLTAEELVHILRKQCSLYRIRYDDAFADWDKMRRGTVTAEQFESVLGSMPLVQFALTGENVEVLVAAYAQSGVDEGFAPPRVKQGPTIGSGAFANRPMVVYQAFLYDINPLNFKEVAPNGTSVATNYFSSTHKADQFISSAEEQQAADSLLRKIRALVQANRIFLTPVLRDFDRVRKGIYEHRTCTHTRFTRALATQSLLLAPEELQLLIRKYTIPNPDGTSSGDVDYYSFVQDVDPSQARGGAGDDESTVPRPTHATLHGIDTAKPTTAEAVLQRIAEQVQERRLRLEEFFADSDPLHRGMVPPNKLGVAFTQAGLLLQSNELQALESCYAGTQRPPLIDVTRLLSDIEKVVAKVAVLNRRSVCGGTTTSTSAAGCQVSEDAAPVELILRRVRHNVHVYNALLTPFFAEFDHQHRGCISRTQFHQAVSRHQLPLTEAEVAQLSDWYSSGSNGMVRYLAFIRDVGCGEEAAAAAAAAGEDPPALLAAAQVTAMDHTIAAQSPLVVDVDEVLQKICVVLQERRPRVKEFFPDGDELRHSFVSKARFRHCLTMLGLIDLSEEELQALESGFLSAKSDYNDVDYPAFVCTVRGMLASGAGVTAVSLRRQGCPPTSSAKKKADAWSSALANAAASALFTTTMDKIKRTLAMRRTASLIALREYDRARKGWVKEGQFFACLASLNVPLTPLEASALLEVFSVGNGEVSYIPFTRQVDDDTLLTVS